MFTLADSGIDADTDTDKKWVAENCVEVFIQTLTPTPRQLGFKPIVLVSVVSVGKGKICVGVGQCEHTLIPFNTMVF